jgi:hypothetical protein
VIVPKAHRSVAFTILELLVGMAVGAMFTAGLLAVWSSLSLTALNTTSYSSLQNDQMRVLDYLKRDIHRATKVELLNGATVVGTTGTFAPELRLTIPDYYADNREEDDAIGGSKAANAPVLKGKEIVYGTPLLIRYYTLNGAAVRREGESSRSLADAAAGFAFSFSRETNGAIRCRVAYDQPARGLSNRKLRRTVDTLCVPRKEFQF